MEMEVAASTVGFFIDNKDAIDSAYKLGLLIFGFLGLIFIAVRAFAQRKSAESAKRQADTAEKGHVTDRYIKAIDQLGAMHDKDTPNVEVRLGGIYGLEQVSKESTELYPQIIEILTAYIRTNAVDPLADYGEHTLTNEIIKEKQTGPKTDVQAVITVLGRRGKQYDPPLDFSYTYLANYSFIGGDFSNAIFRLANCWGADFSESDCTSASFVEARCVKALFKRAKCRAALFSKANCERASFFGSDCTVADFSGADCTRANFFGTVCAEASFKDADCTGTDFAIASCKGVDFSQAKVPPADYESLNQGGKPEAAEDK